MTRHVLITLAAKQRVGSIASASILAMGALNRRLGTSLWTACTKWIIALNCRSLLSCLWISLTKNQLKGRRWKSSLKKNMCAWSRKRQPVSNSGNLRTPGSWPTALTMSQTASPVRRWLSMSTSERPNHLKWTLSTAWLVSMEVWSGTIIKCRAGEKMTSSTLRAV